jgi:hypothetical protein
VGAKRWPPACGGRALKNFARPFRVFWITRPLYFPEADENKIQVAQKFNFQRYHYQGIGRYEPSEPISIDAGVYGFVANIYFYKIDTPLRKFSHHTQISSDTVMQSTHM